MQEGVSYTGCVVAAVVSFYGSITSVHLLLSSERLRTPGDAPVSACAHRVTQCCQMAVLKRRSDVEALPRADGMMEHGHKARDPFMLQWRTYNVAKAWPRQTSVRLHTDRLISAVSLDGINPSERQDTLARALASQWNSVASPRGPVLLPSRLPTTTAELRNKTIVVAKMHVCGYLWLANSDVFSREAVM